MKLSVIRLQQLSAQDFIDLGKIWPRTELPALAQQLSSEQQLYAAKFNDRLLAAVKVGIEGAHGRLTQLEVREVTRRRGVGLYLLEEVLAHNPQVTRWWVAQDGSSDPEVISAFMQAAGFTPGADGWRKTCNGLP
ncbi:aspartate 1-decarboxylase autocleavage activator PanM [Erwinia sp. E602]|uniref:aspartate 1-decarboxylase autocleavage activator PanM n=1 Tax=Erwinia sp. E602 TaxID=2675378 RepID=UPI001BABD2CC|nr:aspartate 1-decarboxylase autocleavage activator PanM [Erwinia sp. E602]QUG73964.1 aspartate 1-decarboxylase autocleavage activator PanM [Erwinia sp. E602]